MLREKIKWNILYSDIIWKFKANKNRNRFLISLFISTIIIYFWKMYYSEELSIFVIFLLFPLYTFGFYIPIVLILYLIFSLIKILNPEKLTYNIGTVSTITTLIIILIFYLLAPINLIETLILSLGDGHAWDPRH